MTDEEIAATLQACDVEPEGLVYLITMAGLLPTGDAIADIKALAEFLHLDVEDLLNGMFIADEEEQ